MIGALLAAQTLALLVLAVRLWPGRTRQPPVPPQPDEVGDTTVSVIVATLNEASRVAPCLAGLRAQGVRCSRYSSSTAAPPMEQPIS